MQCKPEIQILITPNVSECKIRLIRKPEEVVPAGAVEATPAAKNELTD